MAGEAKTDNFMLGTCTLMLGPLASLMALNVDDHSVGLVKEMAFKSTPAFTELTQGVKNSLVYSVMTGNDLAVDGQMFEYTTRNLAYAASLDGSTFADANFSSTVNAAYSAPVGPAILGAPTVTLASVVGLVAGMFLAFRMGTKDNVQVRKIVSIAGSVVTLNYGLPKAMAVGVPVTANVFMPMGGTDDQPFLSAKLVGQLANGRVVTILLPKVRLTAGLNVAFQTGDFQSMPVSLRIYDQLPTDPFYVDYATATPQGGLAKASLSM